MMPFLYLLLLSRLVSGGGESNPAGDPVKTVDDNSTIPGNGTSNATVIQCDDAGLFSTYAICAPGKCCSNIPFGITGTIALLTIGVAILSFSVLRQSRGATSPTPKEPTTEKKNDPKKEESLTSQQLAVAAAPQSRSIYPAVMWLHHSLILLLLVMALRVSCGDYTNIRREETLKNKADQDNDAKSNNENNVGMNADAIFHNVLILLTVVFVMSLGAIIYVSKKRFKQSSSSNTAPWVTRNAGRPPAPSGSARFR